MFIKKSPNELDLLTFFESEPTFVDNDSLIYSYSYNDLNLSLIFTFSVIEGWIKVVTKYKDQILCEYLTEGVESFEFGSDNGKEYICSNVTNSSNQTQIIVQIKPCISVNINTLVL